MKMPDFLYPTVVKGIIHATEMRCESIDGSEIWIKAPPGGIFTLKNFKPFVHTDGKTYFPSHLQKRATYFSLLYSPFIFHWGRFWHLQETHTDGAGLTTWLPGTERGIYWRTPGIRWQVPDARSNLKPWIWSNGRFLGGHLD